MHKPQSTKLFATITILTSTAFLIATAYVQKYSGVRMPDGPQGPPFANLPDARKYNLLSYPSGTANSMGAFVSQTWPTYHVNNELQEYIPDAASQDSITK